jgi:spore coat protein CotH
VLFDLELDADALAALSQVRSADDPQQDVYVRGTLRYGAESVVDVGVRLKGEGSFRGIDRKAAFKVKTDAFVPDQTFRGLKRLTFNNMVEDPTSLAERLAYEVFRAAALPAPRCNSALVYVNGEPFGLYANVEAEDKTFLSRWFTSNDGNLYEEGQMDFVPGAERAFVLETNETANDRSDLVGLIQALASSSSDTLIEALDPHLDTRQFLRFTAAEAAVNQWDMYAYTVFYPNNFRIYADPGSARFVFLPWGMDMSMKPFRDSDRPHIGAFALARRGDSSRGPVTAGLMFQRCLERAACVAAYRTELESIITVYEGQELEARAERYFAQIREHVARDPRSEYSPVQVEAGIASLLSTIRERPAALRADLQAQAAAGP